MMFQDYMLEKLQLFLKRFETDFDEINPGDHIHS